MPNRGTTIQIFLPNGDPRGIKEACFTRYNIQVLQIPRAILSQNKNQLDFAGIYVLVDSLRSDKPKIYIGKGNVKSRVGNHDRNSEVDFWNIIFAINLKDGNGFNDADTRYLERHFIRKAKELNLADVSANANIPSEPRLSASLLSDLKHYAELIEVLLSTLGLKCFQPVESEVSPEEIFYCKGKYGDKGEGIYTEDGFLLRKGAICRKEMWPGTPRIPRRDDLIGNGTLKEENGHYVLQEDTIFSSVSTAAAIVLGRSTNGWTAWKNDAGKTLDELKRQ